MLCCIPKFKVVSSSSEKKANVEDKAKLRYFLTYQLSCISAFLGWLPAKKSPEHQAPGRNIFELVWRMLRGIVT